MPASAAQQTATGKPRRRQSRITAKPWRVDGIDGNTSRGRRLADLLKQFADGSGGWSILSPAQACDVRRAAMYGLQLEDMLEQRLIDPSSVTLEQLSLAERMADRARRRLQIAPRQDKRPGSSLQQYIASKRQTPADAPAVVAATAPAPTVAQRIPDVPPANASRVSDRPSVNGHDPLEPEPEHDAADGEGAA
jgi:hypothetical protein